MSITLESHEVFAQNHSHKEFQLNCCWKRSNSSVFMLFLTFSKCVNVREHVFFYIQYFKNLYID